MKKNWIITDGNEAAAQIAYQLSEIFSIYPITPSSSMGELCEAWSAKGMNNYWGSIPKVIEMQSEAGAIGTVHGCLQTGSLATTFTSSQGLLLMIPELYKLAGEFLPSVLHVAARTIATHALSIFGDHSDVMAIRATGCALLCSDSVQAAHDLTLISHLASLQSRIPFVHFFDGFRTSHEISKFEGLTKHELSQLVCDEDVFSFRKRALTPDKPSTRGTSQNPDVFFQAREAGNIFYNKCPEIVAGIMRKFSEVTKRDYKLIDYYGDKDAERIIIIMGSGAKTVEETVHYLNTQGEKVGVVSVRLYRPFSVVHFFEALPRSVQKICVLDRTKEPGAPGDPLYLDVLSMFNHSQANSYVDKPKIIAGRYGLSSKEFRPSMVKRIFEELSKDQPTTHFTIGIVDDLTHTSLDYDATFSLDSQHDFCAKFYGLGADGTVSSIKNSLKIIGAETDYFVQGYSEYDSKKSGSTTVSHLRLSKRPIGSSYLIEKADFIACHQQSLLEKMNVLKEAVEGSVLLVNIAGKKEEAWNALPYKVQKTIIKKRIKLYAIDANYVANSAQLGNTINTVMQTCFFAINDILQTQDSIELIKESIKKSYGKKGELVIVRNQAAVDKTMENLYQLQVPTTPSESQKDLNGFEDAPEFVENVCAKIFAGLGDTLPVSSFPKDGTFPSGTSKFEKRNIANEIPVWDIDLCIQCNKCVLICPHAAIRAKVFKPLPEYPPPATFKNMPLKIKDFGEEAQYSLQVAAEDCTGCELCVEICPVESKVAQGHRALNMADILNLRSSERDNLNYFLNLPEVDRSKIKLSNVKYSQFLQPLFEYSGACSGCGETPYIKLVTQLFGDRTLIANATGCSSIYGGNLPTSPWTINPEGLGPAWANSLFEDNAEFGLGFRVSLDSKQEIAENLLKGLASTIGEELVTNIINNQQKSEADIFRQREYVDLLRKQLQAITDQRAKHLNSLADYLVKKSVWIIGGDGWAYDIGYGGLDHVLASGRNVNVLVLDTEVYSNTGGQTSKSTPRASLAKFSATGKLTAKKDLGLMMMSYGNIYVASVALGANDTQTLRAFMEAEAYDGPSIIIAYSHCIAHGMSDISNALTHQQMAVNSGYWLLYRFNPDLALEGKNPLSLDSKPPKIEYEEFAKSELRFSQVEKMNPDGAQELARLAKQDIKRRWNLYKSMSAPKSESV